VFKRETGLPPHLFRTLRRIDRGKQLLRDGLPLAQAALAVGFSDQSHFTNTFRKYTGATPGQYLSEVIQIAHRNFLQSYFDPSG
jgi:AraC-like DNA-binding protein